MEQSGQGRFSFPVNKEGIGEAIPFASPIPSLRYGKF